MLLGFSKAYSPALVKLSYTGGYIGYERLILLLKRSHVYAIIHLPLEIPTRYFYN